MKYGNPELVDEVIVKSIPRQKPTDPDCAMRKKNHFIASNKVEQPDLSNLREIVGLSEKVQEEQQPKQKKEEMSKLMDFICEWSISGGTSNFGESYKYRGKMLLEEDGWFEGLIKWPESGALTDYQLVFGVLNKQGIELYRTTSAIVSVPFVYKCNCFIDDEISTSYLGEFFVPSMSGENPVGKAAVDVQDVAAFIKNGYRSVNDSDQDFIWKRMLPASNEYRLKELLDEQKELLKEITNFKARVTDFKKLYDDVLASKQEISERIIKSYDEQSQVDLVLKHSKRKKRNRGYYG